MTKSLFDGTLSFNDFLFEVKVMLAEAGKLDSVLLGEVTDELIRRGRTKELRRVLAANMFLDELEQIDEDSGIGGLS